MSNLNTLHLRRYVDRWKKTEWQTRTEIWIPLQSWWFPSRKHWTSSVMIRFMKGVHDDINQTFSAFNQGTVRPYHGTMPAIMFFKHIFHCSIVDNPVNDAFVVDYCHAFHWNLCPFLVKGLRNYKIPRVWFFEAVIVHPFMHRLFEFELCALMPTKCT